MAGFGGLSPPSHLSLIAPIVKSIRMTGSSNVYGHMLSDNFLCKHFLSKYITFTGKEKSNRITFNFPEWSGKRLLYVEHKLNGRLKRIHPRLV